ncbi:unnamed protein product [Triticum turgidum subsp. durum]|uniref:Disease resistance N-terminal domain-containing protein n=1 Tax=Triticum turgidum subsp. durum TaxID=4567 RepID=A0A9R0YY79_TRITD|nr:unnamed protein product [Triticum turgidum subsp. durum]
MELTTVSIGKSVLNGALGYAKSAVAEEVENNKVVRTWVKQVRDVAYDVEDGIQDFVVRLKKKKSWWHIPRTLLDRRHGAKQMKELRTKVEHVSQRNLHYGLIKGSSSTQPTATAAAAALFGVDEARHAAKQHQARSDLSRLINQEGISSGLNFVTSSSLAQCSYGSRDQDLRKEGARFGSGI